MPSHPRHFGVPRTASFSTVEEVLMKSRAWIGAGTVALSAALSTAVVSMQAGWALHAAPRVAPPTGPAVVRNVAAARAAAAQATAAGRKPNILVIFGDDIGWFNVSAYNRGEMGYRTPNIDRIAREGGIFTDA